ncbi:PREDICTED: uncharacterized protein LOC104595530 isoform X2 [Nelumbo nucifera]|nr:PREDICTED: uncharacterized protein LOC104595530 isoform X2 [Nelumbo nucifera]
MIYPLYASIRAIESGSKSNIQQCLTYWVLFSLIALLEFALAKICVRLPFWPHAKGIVSCMLVVPYFEGAAYVYKRFFRPLLSMRPLTSSIWFNLKSFIFTTQDDFLIFTTEGDFLVAAERYIRENGSEALEKLIVGKGDFEKPKIDSLDGEPIVPTNSKNAQREWSCALCLVSTSSEQCLKKHVQGRKHKNKEEDLLAYKIGNGKMDEPALMLKRISNVDEFKDLNQAIMLKMEWLANTPIGRPIRWCRWEKPMLGWTKLNTDGSIDPQNSGLGGLLRDHMGNPICAFVTKAPRDGIFSLELWAVWRGLVLALGQGIKDIWVESDSMSVVKVINKEWPHPQKAGSCLKHIWEMLRKFDKYRVSHSWREANRAADHLARMDLPSNDVVLWPVDFPVSLVDIIKEDALGKEYRRRL